MQFGPLQIVLDEAAQTGAAHLECSRQAGVGLGEHGGQPLGHTFERGGRLAGEGEKEVAQPGTGARCEQRLVTAQLVPM